jgi:hypothetical protein
MEEKRKEKAIPSVLADEVEDGEVWWRWWAVATGGGASRRSQHDPRDRIRVLRWGPVAANLVLWAPGPHLSLIVCCATGAHQPVERLDTPDQGTIKALTWSTESGGDQLTFSPLISCYTLTLNFDFNCFHFYLFHHKLVYRACLIVNGQSPIDLTATIHISDLKQILCGFH